MAVLGPVRDFLKRYPIDKGIGLGFLAFDYYTRRREGQGVLQAAGGAGASSAIYVLWPEYGLFELGAYFASRAAAGTMNWAKNKEYHLQTAANRGYIGGAYRDTLPAATMRQAGMRAIANSYANVQTAFGNEARMYAR